MPELPEVETIRQDLRKKILNKKIVDLVVTAKAQINKSRPAFKKSLKGKKFTDLDRIGKLLIFVVDKNTYLLIHLKMTGQLVWLKPLPHPPLGKGRECSHSLLTSSSSRGKEIVAGGHPEPKLGEEPNKFTRVSFKFSDGGQLFFNDVRRFGYLKLVNKKELDKVKSGFGIEPLQKNFTLENFQQALAGRKAPIKALLLNQQLFAGIGNIYADEACFTAGVRPGRHVDKLTKVEMKKLHKAVEKVIKKSIEKRGTTFNNFVDGEGKSGYFGKFLQVYGRGGEKCVKCKEILKRTKLAGRGTVYCSKCQK